MAKKKHGLKRKALEAQLADAEQRRTLAETERDELRGALDVADFTIAATTQNSDAFARSVLRAAGVNGNGDLEKVRRLCRGWLDS